jgi:hypothetical protein
VVDTTIAQFVIDGCQGLVPGRAYGRDLTQVAAQVTFWRGIAWAAACSPRHQLEFPFVGKYGLIRAKQIGTCGVWPSLESPHDHLDMISKAKHQLPWLSFI